MLSNRGMRKTENRFRIGFNKIEPSENLISIHTETACNPQFNLKVTKLTFLAFNVEIKNVLKHYIKLTR